MILVIINGSTPVHSKSYILPPLLERLFEHLVIKLCLDILTISFFDVFNVILSHNPFRKIITFTDNMKVNVSRRFPLRPEGEKGGLKCPISNIIILLLGRIW